MEFNFVKKQNKRGRKGQAAIEFILLVVVMLLFINTAIVTNANTASEAALDVSKLGKARLAAEKIVDSVNYVGYSGNSTKQTISVFIPDEASIGCTSKSGSTPGSISFSVELKGDTSRADLPGSGCVTNGGTGLITCAKSIPVFSDLTLSCNPGVTTISGPTVTNYVITKTESTPRPIVSVNFG